MENEIMDVFLASPNNQLQAHAANGMPVLISFALWNEWMGDYTPSYEKLLIDSGAFSEFSTGEKIDINEYMDWAERWRDQAVAIAGLDSIEGDWRQSLDNYEKFKRGFPTFHESDPPGLLNDLISMSKERNQWLGIGLIPPRQGKYKWMKETLEKIPEGIHVHGWACRAYTNFSRIDSVDSTNWWRDAYALKIDGKLKHLTYGECLEIIIKRYQRWDRKIDEMNEVKEKTLFDEI